MPSFWPASNVRSPSNGCENQRQPAIVLRGSPQVTNHTRKLKKNSRIFEPKQAEQHRLEMEMADTEKKKIEFDGKADAARFPDGNLSPQKQGKEAER